MNKCMCYNLHQADLFVTAFYNRYLEPLGLTVRQYTVLSYIAALQPVNVSQLAEAMNLDRTTLVCNLKPLENEKIVADLGGKRRSRQLVLTTQGKQLYKEADHCWQQAQAAFIQRLGKKKSQALWNLLMDLEKLSSKET